VLGAFIIVGTLLAVAQVPPGPPRPPEAAPGQTAPVVETPVVQEDLQARLFVQKCVACHTIGRGRLTGPDLNESVGWAPADLARAVKKMEVKVGPLPDLEVQALVEFLKAADVRERLKAEEARAAAAVAAQLAPPSAEAGERLFHGTQPLQNGGLACIACHIVAGRGGKLGPDLTGVYDKLGETPLVSACEKASYKIMAAAYRDHPITKQEALHLTRYLSTVAAATPQPEAPLIPVGSFAGVVCVGVLMLLYRRRAGVRARLVRRAADGLD
jgi:cytochrome c2